MIRLVIARLMIGSAFVAAFLAIIIECITSI